MLVLCDTDFCGRIKPAPFNRHNRQSRPLPYSTTEGATLFVIAALVAVFGDFLFFVILLPLPYISRC